MLYINVYLVSQQYGGPEESGWYYNVGEPLASIPVPTSQEKGKGYYLSDGIHIRECYCCGGTGKVENEDEDTGEVYEACCQDCGEIPSDLVETWRQIQVAQELFKDLPGRYEHIQAALEDHFAEYFPKKRPHYE